MTRNGWLNCSNVQPVSNWVVVSTVLTTLFPLIAGAQDLKFKPTCAPDDPKSCIQPLIPGEPAPWSGQLMNTRRAIITWKKLQGYDAHKDLDIENLNEKHAIDIQLARDQRASDKEAANEKYNILNDRLEEALRAAKTPFYEKPLFIAIITAGGTALIVTAMFKLAHKAQGWWPGLTIIADPPFSPLIGPTAPTGPARELLLSTPPTSTTPTEAPAPPR